MVISGSQMQQSHGDLAPPTTDGAMAPPPPATAKRILTNGQSEHTLTLPIKQIIVLIGKAAATINDLRHKNPPKQKRKEFKVLAHILPGL